MHVSAVVWLSTLAGLAGLLALDLFHARKPHDVGIGEAARWTAFYVAVAIAFGVGVLWLAPDGPRYAGEFYAGWLTEYSLSIDNLFVFVVIMSRFAVPSVLQQRVLMVGIVLALLMRGAFIAVGATAIERFSWVFYFFGAFLLYTAVQLLRSHGSPAGGAADPAGSRDNLMVRSVRRFLPTTDEYDGARMFSRRSGRLVVTPMLLVMLAIGSTDLLFALDSIPAVFGLTKEPYLVFTANAFALLGLRQLYFLLSGLLDRLVYLGKGLAVVLAFIGVKLVLEALHTNELDFVNGGEPVAWVPQLPSWLSLGVIIVTLAVTTLASLLASRSRGSVAGTPRT